MSISSSFLNLSMKQQIGITIIVLTLFSILVILAICCTLLYEILNQDYKNKKNFFYNKYKQYMEIAFYYQSFHIMQYEEILHRIQKQILKVEQSPSIFTNFYPLEDYSDYIINMTHRDTYNFTELDEKESKENPYFYIISRSPISQIQDALKLFCLVNYQTFTNSLFSYDIYDSFRIPGYGVPKVNKKYDDFFIIAPGRDDIILQMTINGYVNSAKWLLIYIKDKLEMFSHIFPKLYNELDAYPKTVYYEEEARNNLAKQFVGYVSTIEYGADTFSLVTSVDGNGFYYTQMNTIPNLLFFLNNDFSSNIDIDFIPFYFPNRTLISKDLCALFKNKQYFLSGKQFDFEEVYNNIHHRETGLEDCFIDNNLINFQEGIKDVFDIFADNFSKVENMMYQGILEIIPKHSEYPFYFLKYSYPNYNSLREFKTEYLFTNQVDFYAFASFKTVQKYVEHIYQVNLNIFLFTILVIAYLWLILLFINMCIFFKVIDEWTSPITKLQEAVESSSLKDESIFIYKYDDIINELFLTCKELLSGQINNTNDYGINNFNILRKDNEKKIDKNIYKKNLIINNDIMEELIDRQQSEMDFSNNVKLNDANNFINDSIFDDNNKTDTKMEQSDENKSTNLDSNSKSHKEKKDNKTNKNENNKENESFIKLFQISEYLDYYRSKLDTNNVMISNDTFDETKSSHFVSKKNDKSINSSISNQKKNKNDEANENNYINMMDESNITYLWYMESKRNNNIFNYKMSNNYKELFTEYYDNNKCNSPNEKKF